MPISANRPIWEQLNITKVKRGSDTIFTMDEYEIVMRYENSDSGPLFSLRHKDDSEDDEVEFENPEALARFIDCIAHQRYQIPFPPLPSENEAKIKEAEARLKLVMARKEEIDYEIRQLKAGYKS